MIRGKVIRRVLFSRSGAIVLYILLFVIAILLYTLYPNWVGSFAPLLNILLSLMLIVITYFYYLATQEQTKVLASPVVDAIGKLSCDKPEIELEIANVGNYVARNPQIIVDVETKDMIFRYSCKIFPSLPAKSKYQKPKIKPKFEWKSEKDKSEDDGVKIIDVVDLFTLIKRLQSEHIKQISIRAIFISENHEPITLFEEKRCITITVLPKSKLKKFIVFLKNLQQNRSHKQIVEYSDLSPIKFKIEPL